MSYWDINSDEISKLKTFVINNKDTLIPYSYFNVSTFNVWDKLL